jgi:hypothetical protein
LTIRRTVFYDAIGLETVTTDGGAIEDVGFSWERFDGD